MNSENDKVEKYDPHLIHAQPTKELLITTLVRDLTLRDAIGDLVDNSVDAARSFANGSYEGLKIEIHATPEYFHISDNCGGFSVNIARNYAFCFGRPEGHPETPGSIGRFGIGMKRALFKMGNVFKISSTTPTTTFEMEVNVEKWRKQNEWDFRFKSYDDNGNFGDEQIGTRIQVSDLKKDITEQFANSNFMKKLRNEIELEHLYTIHKGLVISLNNKPLMQRQLDFIQSEEIKPGYWQGTFHKDKLKVDVYAGISKDEGSEGGWYIFCNQRLIVGPETSFITGWTGRKGDGVAEYHDQFHRFRGYVFFEAENAELLPWNTTKTGMDLDSPSYRAVRQQMIVMMKPVMTLMNLLKKEREGGTTEEERVYHSRISSYSPVPLSQVMKESDKLPSTFEFPPPEPKVKRTNKGARISYYKPKEEVQRIKEYFGVETNKEVGEKTFEYFYDMEIE